MCARNADVRTAVSGDAASEAMRQLQAPEVAPPHGVLPLHLAGDGSHLHGQPDHHALVPLWGISGADLGR